MFSTSYIFTIFSAIILLIGLTIHGVNTETNLSAINSTNEFHDEIAFKLLQIPGEENEFKPLSYYAYDIAGDADKNNAFFTEMEADKIERLTEEENLTEAVRQSKGRKIIQLQLNKLNDRVRHLEENDNKDGGVMTEIREEINTLACEISNFQDKILRSVKPKEPAKPKMVFAFPPTPMPGSQVNLTTKKPWYLRYFLDRLPPNY